jgi:ubiquinone/menaquinone biosynthesis C-methylase UbiE
MADRRDVRDAYDAIAAGYDEHRSNDPGELEAVATFADDLGPDAHVLDAGCGAAEPVTTYLDARVRTTGLDFSRGQLALAADRVAEAGLVQGDMTSLPFPDGTFDGMVSMFAVIHIPREEHARVFAEFARVLRPGSPALVTVGSEDWRGENTDWMGLGREMQWDIPGVERARELLAEVGFDIEDVSVYEDDVSEEAGDWPVLSVLA